jgi:hypothetical protein
MPNPMNITNNFNPNIDPWDTNTSESENDIIPNTPIVPFTPEWSGIGGQDAWSPQPETLDADMTDTREVSVLPEYTLETLPNGLKQLTLPISNGLITKVFISFNDNDLAPLSILEAIQDLEHSNTKVLENRIKELAKSERTKIDIKYEYINTIGPESIVTSFSQLIATIRRGKSK